MPGCSTARGNGRIWRRLRRSGRGRRLCPWRARLDFQLAFYLGYLARNQGDKLVVVAIDNDYAPLIEHANHLGIDVTKVAFKRSAAAGSKKTAAKKVTAKKKPAAKKARTKSPPAKKVIAKKTVAQGGCRSQAASHQNEACGAGEVHAF